MYAEPCCRTSKTNTAHADLLGNDNVSALLDFEPQVPSLRLG